MMKQFPQMMLTVFIGLIATFGLFARSNMPVTTNVPATVGTIDVTGSAQVYAPPDKATTSMRILVQSNSVGKLYARSEFIFAALRRVGISSTQMKTGDFDFNIVDNTQRYIGQRVDIVFYNFEQIDDFLRVMSQYGVEVDPIYFSVESWDKLEQQARDEALLDARTKAQTAAEIMGSELGDVVSIRFSDFYSSNPQGSYAFGVVPRSVDIFATVKGVPILPGHVTTGVTAYITFELKPKS